MLAFLHLLGQADEGRIDASDPTRIYTFIGGGLKYNNYTNGEYMLEARAIGKVSLGEQDMLLFEAGSGLYHGDQATARIMG